MTLVRAATGGSSSVSTLNVAQASHGFTVNQHVRCTGLNTWAASEADAASHADFDGVVTTVTDANNFVVTLAGWLVSGYSGLSPGTEYYDDPATPGAITATEPTTAGQVTEPVGKAITTTQLLVRPQRGIVVPSPATYTVPIILLPDSLGLTTGEDFAGQTYTIPSYLNGWSLTVGAPSGTAPTTTWTVATVSSSGTPTLGIRKGASTEMLSTSLTIDANEATSDTAATPAVAAGGGAATVATGDVIHFDCDVAGTGTKGSILHLTFTSP